VNWPSIDELSTRAPLPEGYHYELLSRKQVPELIAAIELWYPGIAVGNASCHLREDFYTSKVYLKDEVERDFIVILFRRGDELVGMFSAELDRDSEVLYGRIAVIAPNCRGAHLSRNCLMLEEAMGRAMGLGMVYGLATMRYPQMQATFQRLGWHLIGITPGFDQEMVAPGVVKRVYEAVYAKVLVGDDELLRPRAGDMTPAVRALFDLLYPGRIVEQTS
jgi:hypothetical protein